MGMSIDDIKHCLLTMIDCELCEECNLYGTTGTDHCEHDCVYGALEIINKYQKIQKIINNAKDSDGAVKYNWLYEQISGVMEDGTD